MRYFLAFLLSVALWAQSSTVNGVASQSNIPGTTSAKTSAYTIVASDAGKTITLNTAATFTLPQAGSTGFPDGWPVTLQNISATGFVTISTTTSTFIGTGGISGTTAALSPGQTIGLKSNGTNWQVSSNTSHTSFVPGMSSAYLLRDGSGTTAADGSGNGRNCTFGTTTHAPTWSNQGLSFVSSSAQYMTCSATPWSSPGTIQVWLKENLIPVLGAGSAQFFVLGTDDNDSAIIMQIQSMGALGVGQNATNLPTQTVERINGPMSFSFTPSTGVAYLNGRPSVGYTLPIGSTAFTGTTNVTIGAADAKNAGFNGNIYATLTYSSALTAAQVAQNDGAMREFLSAYGVFFSDPDRSATPAIIWNGDSITRGTGTAPNSQIWPIRATWALSKYNFFYINNGIAGSSAFDWPSYLNSNTILPLGLFGIPQSSVVHIALGINDLAFAQTASSIFTNLQSFGTSIHAAGARCVISTVTQDSALSGGQQTELTTLNSTIISNWLAGTLNCDSVDDYGGDPILGLKANSSAGAPYYNTDHVHPTSAGALIIAARAPLSILDALSGSYRYWLDVNVPALNSALNATAATTATINLLQLGPSQQVCGIQANVTSNFGGGSIAVETVTIGDSTGTSSQYASSMSILAANSVVNLAPNFRSANGIVQAAFSSTGANLSVNTGGNLHVGICVERP